MRSVSGALLAAQREGAQRPRVRVLVRDKQARIGLVGRQSTANVQAAACTTGDGSRIVIATLDEVGRMRVRVVTDPTVLASAWGWGYFTGDFTVVVAPGGALAWPDGDVCVSDSGGTLRIFYVKSDGSEILAITSTDRGATWSAPATVRVVAGGTTGYRFCLASAGHDDLWYTIGRSGYRYVYMGEYAGGSWGSWTYVQYIMETGGEYENCYGLAAQWDTVAGKYCVVASLDRASGGDGRIVSAHWDLASATISDFRSIVPPGYPMVGFVPWRPALLKTSETLGPLWVLTYWDTFTSGATSWSTPVCILSRDFDHWSYKIPMSVATFGDRKRISVVELANVVYCHCIQQAYKVDLWYTGKTVMELTVAQEKVLRYRINERPEQGQLHVEIDNRGGTYDHPGESGHTAEAMRPLAQVVVDQGLNTWQGDLRVESRPFYLWSHSTVRDSGVNLVRLYCVDGWQLLRMWRPDCTISWEDKTLEWCIAEVAARAGNWEVVTDGSAEWSQVLNYLTVAASYDDVLERWYVRSVARWVSLDDPVVMFGTEMSGLTILQHLLSLVGGAARFGNGDDREVLYVFIPAGQGENPTAVHGYGDGEILALQDVDGFAWPTRVLVTGSAGGYEGRSVASAQAVGMDFLQMVYASQWATAAQLETIALGLLDDAAARAWAGWARTRPNVGLELFDVILWTDLKAGSGLVDRRRRVNGILTEYDPLQRLWQQTLYLEGA